MKKIQNLKFKNQNFGYTLIEILVGLTITALIFSGGYTNYRDFVRREALSNAFNKLEKDLNLARQRSLSGEKPTNCASYELRGYNVSITGSGYSVTASCGPTSVPVREFRFPQGITASPNQIFFKTLGQGTTSSSDEEVTLTQDSTNEQRILTVTSEGSVK